MKLPVAVRVETLLRHMPLVMKRKPFFFSTAAIIFNVAALTLLGIIEAGALESGRFAEAARTWVVFVLPFEVLLLLLPINGALVVRKDGFSYGKKINLRWSDVMPFEISYLRNNNIPHIRLRYSEAYRAANGPDGHYTDRLLNTSWWGVTPDVLVRVLNSARDRGLRGSGEVMRVATPAPAPMSSPTPTPTLSTEPT
jgi:hypothetical protein